MANSFGLLHVLSLIACGWLLILFFFSLAVLSVKAYGVFRKTDFQMLKPGVLVAVCDYPGVDMAAGEVQLELFANMPTDWKLLYQASPGMDTLATGFIAAQLANKASLIKRFGADRYLVYVNCAPRADDEGGRINNQGEGLVLAELDNGVNVLVVNAGYNLSFLKPQIRRLRALNCPDFGSQFRSRDVFPGVVGEFAHGLRQFGSDFRYDKFGSDLEVDALPDVPPYQVVYIDSFGNVKLSTRRSDLHFAEGTKVAIGKTNAPEDSITALVTSTSFAKPIGVPVLSCGSSGYDQPFVEIFIRCGSAQRTLGVQVGDMLTVRESSLSG